MPCKIKQKLGQLNDMFLETICSKRIGKESTRMIVGKVNCCYCSKEIELHSKHGWTESDIIDHKNDIMCDNCYEMQGDLI